MIKIELYNARIMLSPINQIWVLGSKSPNADRSISWTKLDLPNLSDPDMIIINLVSLNEHILGKIDRHTISRAVSDKLENGGIVVFITDHLVLESRESHSKLYSRENNYFASPFTVNVHDVSEGQIINYDSKRNPLSEYLKEVRKFKFTLQFRPSPSNYFELSDYVVTNNNNNHLGGAFRFESESPKNQGIVVYLPPPTEISIEDGIDILLKIFGKRTSKASFPSWVAGLPLNSLTLSYDTVSKLKEDAKEIQTKIRKKENEIQNLMNYYGLLTSRDDPLQSSVYQAFSVLGITLKQKRAKNLEDGVFDFNTISSYEHGVIEVKGSNKRTSMSDIAECSKWVDQYYTRGLGKSKGIFISNQYRLQKYPESRDKRIHFEFNEIEFAEEKKICILPSCVLFETVRNILNGSSKPGRSDIEKTLSTTSGLLTSLS